MITAEPAPELADGWFTEQIARHQTMTREELIREARVLAWNFHRRAVLAEAYRTGSDHMIRDLRRPLARAWALLDWRKKTVKMEDLRRAIDLEWAEEQDRYAAHLAQEAAEVTGA